MPRGPFRFVLDRGHYKFRGLFCYKAICSYVILYNKLCLFPCQKSSNGVYIIT